MQQAFGFASSDRDAFARVGFGFEAEAFFVFTGADGSLDRKSVVRERV